MERKTFNSKRRIQPPPSDEASKLALDALARSLKYVGNAQHKRNGGDFGLTPPAALRQGKSICDDVVNCKADAQALLLCGAAWGLISVQVNGGFPQNVWAVTARGDALEAMLDNAGSGTYHGYPMPDADPLRLEVLERWRIAKLNP